jgi:hypothetical protein
MIKKNTLLVLSKLINGVQKIKIMSNVLKSKSVFGVMIVAALAVVLAFTAATTALAYTHTVTLKMGSTGSQVMSLQVALNGAGFVVATSGAGSPGMESTYFGAKTKAAVMSFQAAHGLTADGVVGPMTGAALAGSVSNGGGSGSFPAGCTSTSGYSVTTGMKCDGSGSGSGSGSTSGPLKGGAGDLTLSSTSTDVEDTLKEGEDDVKIFGVKAEADGSDIAITSVKLTFANCEAGDCDAAETSSENFTKYVDEVSIWMDGKKVGSADASDFTRDSGSPDEYTKTISLSNAIIREDDDAKLYVAVTGASTIDTDDLGADWDVRLETMRFTDATGAILSADVNGFDAALDNDTFSFEDVSTDDQIDLRTSTANPDDATVQVEENATSDETLALAFKLDVDNDSSDVDITSIQIDVAFTGLDTDGDDDSDSNDDSTSDSAAENVIDSVMIKIGGDEFEADLDSVTIANGAGSAHYTADIDSGDLTINSGDVEEGKVYLTFNDQDGNYLEGTTVTASVSKANIDAETDEDELTVTGSTTVTGAELTLRANGADFQFDSASTSTTGDSDEIGTFKVKFTATAFGDDIYIPKAGATAVDFDILKASDDSVYSTGTQTVSITSTSGAEFDNFNDEDGNDEFLVSDEESFTITVTLDNTGHTSGQYYLKINSISFFPNEEDALETATVNEDFQTESVFVGS